MKRKPDLLWILVILFGLGVVTTGYAQTCGPPRMMLQSRSHSSSKSPRQALSPACTLIVDSLLAERSECLRHIPAFIRYRALQRYIPTGLRQSIDFLTLVSQPQ